MAGAALTLGGGINAVVRLYRDHGLFERWSVLYLDTYTGKGALRQLCTMLRAVLRLAALLLRRRVALLHVHAASRGSFWRKAALCGLCRLAGVPYVFHLHSGEFPAFYRNECRPWQQRLVRRVLAYAAEVLVLTPSWLALLRAIEPTAVCRVMLNPVALASHVQPVQPVALRLLFLGRLRRTKGVFDLLDALPALRRSWPGVRAVLAGDGELQACADAAQRLGVADIVELPGWIDGADKDRALAEADVLVLPSHAEGLPVCVLEAMAAGVPVVASAVGGIPHALDDGRCGELVPPRDVQALTAALHRMLAEPGHRALLATRARARAEALFSPDSVLRELQACWQPLLGRPKGRA